MLLEAGHAHWDTADHYTPEKHQLICWEALNLAGVPSTTNTSLISLPRTYLRTIEALLC